MKLNPDWNPIDIMPQIGRISNVDRPHCHSGPESAVMQPRPGAIRGWRVADSGLFWARCW